MSKENVVDIHQPEVKEKRTQFYQQTQTYSSRDENWATHRNVAVRWSQDF